MQLLKPVGPDSTYQAVVSQVFTHFMFRSQIIPSAVLDNVFEDRPEGLCGYMEMI